MEENNEKKQQPQDVASGADNIAEEPTDAAEQLDVATNMSFLEHIDELRKRLIIAVVGLLVSCAAVAYFISDLMNEVFLKPAFDAELQLQNLMPFGQPFLYFKVIFAAGIIVSIPFTLYQFWKFISPALYANERKWIANLTILTSVCFFVGVVFAYFVLIPSMLSFASNFGSELIENKIDVNSYFGFVSMMLVAAGAIFEMPIISFILTKLGLVNSKFLSKYRRHSVVIILILAAVITPTPDPISQAIFAFPVYLLFELSIFIS